MFVYVILLIVYTSELTAQTVHLPWQTLDKFNHDLQGEFQQIDTDRNGIIDLQEFEYQVQIPDVNADGCVSSSEFLAGRTVDPEVWSRTVFDHLDFDHNGCISVQDEVDEFHAMDINPKDSGITLIELDTYLDKIFELVAPLLGLTVTQLQTTA